MSKKPTKKTTKAVAPLPLEEEHRIRKAFKDKDWAEIKSSDSWVIFKVMSEFVEGFEKMAKIGPCVTIFGSARIKPISPQSLPPRGLCGKFVFRHISALSILKSEIQLRHVHGLA